MQLEDFKTSNNNNPPHQTTTTTPKSLVESGVITKDDINEMCYKLWQKKSKQAGLLDYPLIEGAEDHHCNTHQERCQTDRILLSLFLFRVDEFRARVRAALSAYRSNHPEANEEDFRSFCEDVKKDVSELLEEACLSVTPSENDPIMVHFCTQHCPFKDNPLYSSLHDGAHLDHETSNIFVCPTYHKVHNCDHCCEEPTVTSVDNDVVCCMSGLHKTYVRGVVFGDGTYRPTGVGSSTHGYGGSRPKNNILCYPSSSSSSSSSPGSSSSSGANASNTGNNSLSTGATRSSNIKRSFGASSSPQSSFPSFNSLIKIHKRTSPTNAKGSLSFLSSTRSPGNRESMNGGGGGLPYVSGIASPIQGHPRSAYLEGGGGGGGGGETNESDKVEAVLERLKTETLQDFLSEHNLQHEYDTIYSSVNHILFSEFRQEVDEKKRKKAKEDGRKCVDRLIKKNKRTGCIDGYFELQSAYAQEYNRTHNQPTIEVSDRQKGRILTYYSLLSLTLFVIMKRVPDVNVNIKDWAIPSLYYLRMTRQYATFVFCQKDNFLDLLLPGTNTVETFGSSRGSNTNVENMVLKVLQRALQDKQFSPSNLVINPLPMEQILQNVHQSIHFLFVEKNMHIFYHS